MATALRRRPKRGVKDPLADIANLAELLDRLGNVPLERIRLHPRPGTATEEDVVQTRLGAEPRLCELIDGVLVEKPMGTKEALWAALIVHYFWDYLEKHDLGLALGADAFVRLFPGRVRIPDFSFFSWDALPGGELPDEAIASIVPDLAGEVLSKSNTPKEIDLKLDDYFKSGVKLVWVVDPKTESAVVHADRRTSFAVKRHGVLRADAMLPGFSLSLKKLFAHRGRKKPK